MKKVRKLSFLGILSVLAVVLFLAGISFMQAQVQTQGKPEKPPGKPEEPEQATWKVSIPIGGDTMLFGDGSDYITNELDNVEVTVEKNSPGAWRRDNDFVTTIVLKISNPTDRFVDFNGVNLLKIPYEEGEDYNLDYSFGAPCGVFPSPYNGCQSLCDACDPFCMQDFINDEFHPYTNSEESTYRYFLIELCAFDKDILTMEVDDEPYLLGTYGHYHDYIEMTLRYQTQDIAPTYHNISFYKSAHRGEEAIYDFNIWITRTGENTWRVDVGTLDDPQFLRVDEYYYETVQRGKNLKLDGWYTTLYAGGDFHFSFDLIRTLPSS